MRLESSSIEEGEKGEEEEKKTAAICIQVCCLPRARPLLVGECPIWTPTARRC